MFCIESLIKEKGKKRNMIESIDLLFKMHILFLCVRIIEFECFEYVIKIVYEKLHALCICKALLKLKGTFLKDFLCY
jgi:hypothetical protein